MSDMSQVSASASDCGSHQTIPGTASRPPRVRLTLYARFGNATLRRLYLDHPSDRHVLYGPWILLYRFSPNLKCICMSVPSCPLASSAQQVFALLRPVDSDGSLAADRCVLKFPETLRPPAGQAAGEIRDQRANVPCVGTSLCTVHSHGHCYHHANILQSMLTAVKNCSGHVRVSSQWI